MISGRKLALQFVLSCLILAGLPAFATLEECDFEAKTPVQAAVGILRSGFEIGLLDLQQLREFGKSHTWENLFRPYRGNENGLAHFKGFQRVSRLMGPTERSVVRAQLLSLISQLESRETSRSDAREKTQTILGKPKLLRTLTVPGFNKNSWEIPVPSQDVLKANLDGRPIFVAWLVGPQGDKAWILFDPFNSDIHAQALILLQRKMQFVEQSHFIVERNGTPYFVSLDNDFVFDLRLRKKVSTSIFYEKKPDLKTAHRIWIAQTKSGPKLIEIQRYGSVGDPKVKFSLHLHDWSLPGSQKKSFDPDCGSPQFHEVSGRHFVTCTSAGQDLQIFDVEGEKFLAPQHFPTEPKAQQYLSMFYEDNGAIYLATLMPVPFGFSLFTVELNHRENLRYLAKLPIPKNYGTFKSRGVPHYFSETAMEEGIAGSLREGQSPYQLATQRLARRSSFFEWNEDTYRFSSAPDGKYFLENMTLGTLVTQYDDQSEFAEFSQAFTYQENIYAFIGGRGQLPQILQLTVEESK